MIPRGASAGARIPHAAAAPLPPSDVPGLLMHFDGDFTDECRGRSFTLTGGSPPIDALTTDACAGSHALWVGSGGAGSPMPISTSQFPQDFNVGSGGAVTIEYFASTTGWENASGVFITFSDALDPVNFIWQVRHSSAEAPTFLYQDPSGNVRAKYRAVRIPVGDGPTTPGPWTHVAFVITPTEVRMYVGGVLANDTWLPLALAAPIKSAASGVLTVAAHYTVRVDDLRILPQEVYTGSSFTPPGAPLSRTHPPT